MKNLAQENEKAISGAIKIDKKEIRTHLDGLVRQSVEDTLNALLNAEADAICQASRYQRSPDQQDTRGQEAINCKHPVTQSFSEAKLPYFQSAPFPLPQSRQPPPFRRSFHIRRFSWGSRKIAPKSRNQIRSRRRLTIQMGLAGRILLHLASFYHSNSFMLVPL